VDAREVAVTLSCVFCGAPLAPEHCIWVQLTDGGQFVCCPAVCPPLQQAIEELRRSRARAAPPPAGAPVLSAEP